MALTDMKFVYRHGTNSPNDPINGYQVMDSGSEQWPGIAGDLLYEKGAGRLWINNGTGHFLVYPQTLDTSLSSIYIVAPITLNDTHDILVCGPGTGTVTLHDAGTAKRKRYTIKAWWTGTVTISPSYGQDIDASPSSISVTAPGSVTLVPVNSSWAII